MNVRINYRLAALAILFSTSSLMGDDEAKPAATSAAATPEVTPFLVPSLEEKFVAEANKADAITAKAEAEATKLKKVAAEARLKGYKDKLAEITKTGDFDKAQQVKARITQLENDPELASSKHNKKLPGGVKIISATYGVNQSWFDVTDKLENALLNKTSIVTDAVFGDPAPEYQPGNTLVVRYEKKGEIKIIGIYSGKPLVLP